MSGVTALGESVLVGTAIERAIIDDVLPRRTFSECVSLKTVGPEDTAEGTADLRGLTLLDIGALSETAIESAIIDDTLPESVFSGCTKLKTVGPEGTPEGTADLRNVTLGIASLSGTAIRKAVLDVYAVLPERVFMGCSLLAEANLGYLQTFREDCLSGCALVFFGRYPAISWDDSNVNTYAANQTPKLHFSLDSEIDYIYVGESYTEPTGVFRTIYFSDYGELIAEAPVWLKAGITLPAITKNGSVDTNTPGEYTLTYTIPQSVYADTYSIDYKVRVNKVPYEVEGWPSENMRVGETIELVPNGPGGDWDYDSDFWEVDKSIMTANFTAKKAGTTTITYKCESVGESSRTIVIEPAEVYTITPIVGKNGRTDPKSTFTVPAGGSVTFLLMPDSGYVVDKVTVNGNVVVLSEEDKYTFTNVWENSVIHVTFKAISGSPQTADRSNLGLCIGLMLSAGAALMGVLARQIKRTAR